jgi:CTP-dependent riboflavin kinase
MKIAEGYKQTEVGVIPEDWEVKAFSELFDFQNGVNADKEAYRQFPSRTLFTKAIFSLIEPPKLRKKLA